MTKIMILLFGGLTPFVAFCIPPKLRWRGGADSHTRIGDGALHNRSRRFPSFGVAHGVHRG